MSNFIIAVGHTASGNVGCGVVARLDESNNYNFEDCYVRANEANDIAKYSEVELYVEIHINAGGGTGTEVCVSGKSEMANQYASKVSKCLANALNLTNRGVKTRSLIVLNKTVSNFNTSCPRNTPRGNKDFILFPLQKKLFKSIKIQRIIFTKILKWQFK